MEPEGSLPHSQVPANCPYPEPDQSSPYPRIIYKNTFPVSGHVSLPEDGRTAGFRNVVLN